MPKKFSGLKKNPPPPTPSKSNSNGSLAGNVVGGMASGFGIGTGIEAARGLGNAVFGGKDTTQTDNITNQNNEGCKILSDMIANCKDKNDGFNDCNDLLQMFSAKCLPN
tara:strand:- start:61 stop:387 length:327 start_codon:yes stop_codon:yes gene_type:complete